MSLINTNVTVLEVNQNTINKPFEVGYKGDHNAYKLVFSDLVGDGYSVLFWKPMSNHCVFVPLVNNEWLLGNEVLSTSGTLYCQVVKKDESNNFIKHSQVFMLSVNESAPCTQQAFEEVPPNFKIAYDEMVAIIKKVNEALTSGKFNGLSAYELAVKNGFEGTEAEWIESLKYWNSPEFTKLAEQVRADKEHVDTVVAEFDTKANQANTDFDTKVNTANTEFDKKVADANNAFDEKVKTANDAFDKKVTDADTNFTGKVNKANTDLDTKVTQINQDLDAKETAINQALDAKITEANSVIDAKVQESATSAENAKQSELKAQSIADNMQGLTNAFSIDTSEQGRVITATDSSENVINGLKVFGESTQVQSTGKNLFNQEDLLNTDSPNYDKSQGGSGMWFYKVQVKGPVVVSIATTTTTSLYLAVSNTPNLSGVVGWLVHKSSANKNGYVVVNSPQENTIWLGVNNNLTSIKQMLEACEGIMICDGTVNKQFEPFTNGKPSPSPEVPQPIISKVVNKIVINNSNLFDVSKITDVWNGVFGIKNEGGTLSIVCSETSNGSVFTEQTLKDICPALKIGETYVFSAESSATKVGLYFNKSDKYVNVGTPFTIDDKSLKSKVRFFLNKTLGDSGTLNDIRINLGTKVLDYEPYENNQTVTLSKPITLNGIPVEKDGNVTIDGKQYISDVITQKDGVYGVERNVNNISLNGTENIQFYKTNSNSIDSFLYTQTIKIRSLSNNAFSNVLPYNTLGANNVSIESIRVNNYDLWLRFNNDRYKGNVDDLKVWLSKNIVDVCYIVENPTFEPLPEADQQALKALKSNYPTAVITNDDSAFMQLDYVADTKNYIDNRLSEIKTAIIASKGV